MNSVRLQLSVTALVIAGIVVWGTAGLGQSKIADIAVTSEELASQPSEKLDPGKLPARIRQLLVARRDALKTRAEYLMRGRDVGIVGLAEFTQGQRDLIQAELQLNEDPQQRLALLRENVDMAAMVEESVRAKSAVNAVGGDLGSVGLATAARFEAELQLAREIHDVHRKQQ